MKYTCKGVSILIISIVSSYIFKIDFVKDNHFNLITVNSVLIGFLFTSISILLSFLGEKIVQIFEEAGALKKVYANLINGIIYSLISITVSILNMILFEKYIKSREVINILYSLELVLLMMTIYLLFFVIKDLKTVVDSIKINRIKEREKQKANTELNDIIRRIKESN